MKWKAFEIDTKPFLRFQTIKVYDPSDPLIVDSIEGLYQFGVCILKVQDGELVERDPSEMAAFEVEYNAALKVNQQANLIDTIQRSSFTHLGIEFPMNSTAHLRYMAMLNQMPASADVLSMDNRIINIPNSGIVDFVEDYYKEILILTTPEA
jgi:hypothetical protein